MARGLTVFVAGTAMACLAACSSAPIQDPSQRNRILATTDAGVLRSSDAPAIGVITLNAPPDDVLGALSDAYSDLGIEVRLWNPQTRQVGNKNFSKMYRLGGAPLSTYVGCGLTTTGAAADSYRVTMSLISQVTPNGSGSRVQTELTAYAEDIGSSKGTLACLTLGTLEERIHQLAIKHVGG